MQICKLLCALVFSICFGCCYGQANASTYEKGSVTSITLSSVNGQLDKLELRAESLPDASFIFCTLFFDDTGHPDRSDQVFYIYSTSEAALDLRQYIRSGETLTLVTVKGQYIISSPRRPAVNDLVRDFYAVSSQDNLQSWIPAKFKSLAQLQRFYPHVTSLEESIDWATTQQALDYAGTYGAEILLNPGVYWYNQTLEITGRSGGLTGLANSGGWAYGSKSGVVLNFKNLAGSNPAVMLGWPKGYQKGEESTSRSAMKSTERVSAALKSLTIFGGGFEGARGDGLYVGNSYRYTRLDKVVIANFAFGAGLKLENSWIVTANQCEFRENRVGIETGDRNSFAWNFTDCNVEHNSQYALKFTNGGANSFNFKGGTIEGNAQGRQFMSKGAEYSFNPTGEIYLGGLIKALSFTGVYFEWGNGSPKAKVGNQEAIPLVELHGTNTGSEIHFTNCFLDHRGNGDWIVRAPGSNAHLRASFTYCSTQPVEGAKYLGFPARGATSVRVVTADRESPQFIGINSTK